MVCPPRSVRAAKTNLLSFEEGSKRTIIRSDDLMVSQLKCCCRNPISLSEIELGPSIIKFQETNSLVERISASKLNFALIQSSQEEQLQKHQEFVSFFLFICSQNYFFSCTFSLTFTRLQCCGLKLQGGRKIKGRMHFIICRKTFGVQCCPMQEGSSSEFLGNLRKSLRAPFLRILL